MLELILESNFYLIFTNQTGVITFVLQKYTREEHACVHDVGLKYVFSDIRICNNFCSYLMPE